ncbi:protein IQ-DOMAIN 14-like isoform X2 [Canna indica]|uniref:Protein IQ-DOMAIN 14-like isoform X2 n=1 Tax=Canna indica TaxID=4628 RepID=A0AAQ3KTT6_9LILI|nr:protein IQ-DOMAIN 14-like isoform X2 [Canna indica]
MGRATRWLRSLLGGKKGAKLQKDNASTGGYDTKDKKRWSFAKARHAESMGHSPMSATDVAWLRSFYDDDEEESKHAIAVAVATAAAANAAMTAAQAAMVRLKSLGREKIMLYGSYERWAAVKIQTAFRCYLAKKALRALRGLVRLQALVRGYLVRKQAAITLRRLQALMRAQSVVRPQQARVDLQQRSQRFDAEFYRRRSFERFNIKHAGSEQSYGFDRSPKIVEMDTFQLKSKSFRRASSTYNALEEPIIPISSPLPHKVPSRLSIPSSRSYQDYNYFPNPDKSPYSMTAQNTPRLRPETPTRSVKTDGFLRHALSPSSCPSYMANTSSFAAKMRPQSAPKQRPEKVSPRKKVLPNEMESGAKTPLQADEAYNLKNGIVRKVDRSARMVREVARDYYLDSMW